ncbi:MAG TPA: hypothetical protein PKC03_14520 [Dokdonella sp.]|jgi:hypothetical protein|nr:hypothetical protein [Dokdonella sp.]
MNKPMCFLVAALLALVCAAAKAEQPYVEIESRLTAEQLHATGLDTLSPRQLELLNRLLREESGKAVEAAVAVAKREQPAKSFAGLDEGPISSRLKGSLEGWQPGTVFELENGQQWKVLKGSVKLRETLHAPHIKVVPGIAGRWFLQVLEDMPKARVYRID